jgi:transcriptional regulator with XRE-family HTH domain
MAQNFRKLLAANVKTAREARGLTQEQLGKMARLHRCRIDTIERGMRNVDLDNIKRLADTLGLELSDLFRAWGSPK